MSLKKAVISTVAAAAIATSAFADESTLEQTGNYLVMPAFYALESGNWSTNMRVVNTNTTSAVVAKVVIRSYENSEELLDFPIYLSPGDVWSGDLVVDGGVVHLKSTDDSMVIGTPKAVTGETNPVDQMLHKNCAGSVCTNYGYVEVFALATAPAIQLDPTWTEGTPLDKMTIFNSFYGNGANYLVGTRDGNWTGNFQDLYAQTVVSADGAGSERAMSNMATTVTWDPSLWATESAMCDLSYQQLIGSESTFPIMFGAIPGAFMISEVNNSIMKDRAFVTYYNNNADETQLIVTQPLKHYEDNTTGGARFYDSTNTTYLAATARDNMEETAPPVDTNDTDFSGGTSPEPEITTIPCPTEQCYISTSDVNPEGYTEGYVDFEFLGNDSLNGADDENHSLPAILTVVSGVTVGAQPVVNEIKPAYQAEPIKK